MAPVAQSGSVREVGDFRGEVYAPRESVRDLGFQKH